MRILPARGLTHNWTLVVLYLAHRAIAACTTRKRVDHRFDDLKRA